MPPGGEMQIQDDVKAVLFAPRQCVIKSLQLAFEPRVVIVQGRRLAWPVVSDQLPADQVRVPFATEHPQPGGINVGTDHCPAQPRLIVTGEDVASCRPRLASDGRFSDGHLDVVEPDSAGDLLQAQRQSR